eukprot:TRINITY_DN26512_c0_g1_i1.p2 TRINITY_DN26512_c0_g1~~TRINITY_DN26512_c0_g1_i1.p2  ORF type:complete len:390 (+),score=109.23 TRINITY_DN26512_c0_g1_i1:69-1172(+)
MEDVTRAESRWIFSAELDFWAHAMPIIAGCILAPFMWYRVGREELPLWGYAIVVVFCDVGHVWGTLFRCYLDTEENGRKWLLYNASPVAIFALTFFIHYAWSESAFWMLVGYTAIFHFIRQQWGFLCLYRARAKESKGRLVDRIVHAVGALAPIVAWHADTARSFDWFMRDDPFLVRLPEGCRQAALCVWLATAAAYAAYQVSLGPAGRNLVKVGVMGCCWLTWAVGILCPHKLIAVFFLNMFHAAPSYMIVFFTARNKFRVKPPPTDAERLMIYLTRPGAWPLYIAFFVAIAVVEEVFWEAFVWRDYFPDLFTFEMNALGNSFFTALLSTPQVTHYFLDAFIWKLESNPGLSDYYGLTYTAAAKSL